MKYKILTTALIEVANEEELEVELIAMRNYVEGKNGSVKFEIKDTE